MAKRLHIVSQGIWAAGGQLIQAAFGIISLLIIVRFLSPEDYGVFGLAMVFVGLTGIIVGGHAAEFLVQRETIADRHISATFVGVMGLGAVCSILLVLFSTVFSNLLHQPVVSSVILSMCLLPLIDASGVVSSQLLVRRGAFDDLAKISSSSSFVAAVVGPLLAIAGAGLWSLVAMEFSRRVIRSCLMLLYAKWRPSVSSDRTTFIDVIRFGLKRIENTGLKYIAADLIPRTLIAYGFGAAALGHYVVARRLLDQLNNILMSPVSAVLLPEIARQKSDTRSVRILIERAIEITTWLYWPAVLGLIVVAPILLPELLGVEWTLTAYCVQALAIASLRSPIAGYTSAVLIAYKSLHKMSWLQWISIALGVALILASIPLGLVAVCFALSLRQWMIWPISSSFVKSEIQLSIVRQITLLARAALPALAMAACCFGLLKILPDNASPYLAGFFVSCVGVVLYAVFWSMAHRRRVSGILQSAKAFLDGDRPAARAAFKTAFE